MICIVCHSQALYVSFSNEVSAFLVSQAVYVSFSNEVSAFLKLFMFHSQTKCLQSSSLFFPPISWQPCSELWESCEWVCFVIFPWLYVEHLVLYNISTRDGMTLFFFVFVLENIFDNIYFVVKILTRSEVLPCAKFNCYAILFTNFFVPSLLLTFFLLMYFA